MKKTIKSLFALVLVLFALVSCTVPGGEQGGNEQGGENQGGNQTCEHSTVAKHKGNEAEHWLICDSCGEEYNRAAHSFGDWIVIQEPAVGSEGTQYKKCADCGWVIREQIPAIEVVTGETTGDTMVFAQLPADWSEGYIYYWHNEAGTNNLPSENAVGWPGKPMTLVDPDQHIWGFVVPVGTANVIFNNGSGIQTVDIPFAMEANLYILSDVAGGDGKFTANVGSYEFEGAMEDLNKYPTNAPATMITVYFKVNTSWANQYIYYWGATAGPGWPGEIMTDEGNGVYSYQLPSSATGIVLSDGVDGGDQTNDITPAEGVNAWIVNAIDGKDTVTPCTYADGVFTPVEVAPAAIVYYVRGSMNEWGTDASYQLAYDEATDTATVTVTLTAGDQFKIAESSWNNATTISAQNATFDAAQIADLGPNDYNMSVLVSGTYVITVTGVNAATRTCTIVLAE